MDGHERRSRQSNVPGFGQTHQQHHVGHGHSASTSNAATDHRYRTQQHSHHHSQSNLPSAGGRGGAAAAAAAYPAQYQYQVADLQAGSGSLQYQTDQQHNQQSNQAQHHQQQAAANTQATQQGGQVQNPYHPNMYYPQPLAAPQAATPPSPYEPYSGRSSTGMDVLVAPYTYVPATQTDAPTSAPNPSMAQGVGVASAYGNPAMSYPATQTAQQSPTPARGPDNSLAGYAPGLADGSSGQPQYGQPQYDPTASQIQNASLDTAYRAYEDELKTIFTNVRDGNLADAGHALLRIAEWLLGSAENFGLVRDDEAMHGERLKLWLDFNHCWLAVLQRQKEMTYGWQQTGQRPAGTSILEYDQMETMGKDLVRLCDVMEKHGLVDYQMGVWEEEIIHLLTQCLDLWEASFGAAPSASIPSKSTSSSRRR